MKRGGESAQGVGHANCEERQGYVEGQTERESGGKTGTSQCEFALKHRESSIAVKLALVRHSCTDNRE